MTVNWLTMNIMKFKYLIVLFVLSAIAFTGCRMSEDHNFSNRVFIFADKFVQQLRVQTDENVNEMSSKMYLSMAELEDNDVEVMLRVAPELLDRYRLGYYDESACLLPEGHCILPEMKVVIKAGNISSSPVEFVFTDLAGLDYSRNYVLPVKAETVSGPEVLSTSSTMYFVIREASLINIVADMESNCAWPEWKDFDEVADMETFTLEALVKAKNFDNKEVHTIMGIEDCFLIRVGDANSPKNMLQVACAVQKDGTTERDGISDPSLLLKTDVWYHIAVTFDRGKINLFLNGELRGTADVSGGKLNMTSVNFKVAHSDETDGKPRCFWIGHSYDDKRPFNGSISEVRVWNRVLPEEEINSENHFYKIDIKKPSMCEGLVAYWKFNDGQGNSVKDWSQYGNNLTAESSIVWKEVELPEKDTDK